MSDDQSDGGILQDEGEAGQRRSRIERQISGAGFDDGQHGDDGLRRRLDPDGDQDFGGGAELAQVLSELVGAAIEMAVREEEVGGAEGDGVGGEAGLGFEQLVGAGV